jgi:hypothetical protein
LVDLAARARLEGAREARERAAEERRRFAAANLAALEAEIMEGADEDEAAVREAVAAAVTRIAAFEERRHGRVMRVYQLAGARGWPESPFYGLRPKIARALDGVS